MRSGFQSAWVAGLACIAAPVAAQAVEPPAVVALDPPSSQSQLNMIGPSSWAEPPLPDFPERAESRGIESGFVTVQCGFESDGALQDCLIVAEDPAGAGFGQAVLASTRSARLSTDVVAGAPEGALVRFSMNFRWAFPPPPVGYVGLPEVLASAATPRATVGVKCGIAVEGLLKDCQVIEETAPGLGFGDLALKAAAHARLSETTVQRAREAGGGHTTFSLSFP